MRAGEQASNKLDRPAQAQIGLTVRHTTGVCVWVEPVNKKASSKLDRPAQAYIDLMPKLALTSPFT